MNEKEKSEFAKKNYQAFMSKEFPVMPTFNYQPTSLLLQNGKTIENEYWCENEITPTRFYRWLTSLQRSDNGQVVEVTLDENLYRQLLTMVANTDEQLVFDDVVVKSY